MVPVGGNAGLYVDDRGAPRGRTLRRDGQGCSMSCRFLAAGLLWAAAVALSAVIPRL